MHRFFLLILFLFIIPLAGHGSSLRFLGYGVNDIDRVKIPVDDPNLDVEPLRPADVGATDFTIEFWMRTSLNQNQAPEIDCNNYNWIAGNIIVDRDRFNLGRSFGLSLSQGELNFGVEGYGGFTHTVCTENNSEGLPNPAYPPINVDDGQWHHVALQRQMSSGILWIYVDGLLRAKSDSNTASLTSGDISFPDDGQAEVVCYYGGTVLVSCNQSDPFLVLAAEKHDANPLNYPPYFGSLDELRISSVLRYGQGGNESAYTVPTEKFVADAATLALYHFDSNSGDVLVDALGQAHGAIRFGNNGAGPTGPVWQEDDVPAGANNSSLVQFVMTQARVTEDRGIMQINVRRSRQASGSVSVAYTISDIDTTRDSDYQVLSAGNVLQWGDGDTADKAILLEILDDTEPEAMERLTIDLVVDGGAVELGANSRFSLSIDANDGVPSTPNASDAETGSLGIFGLVLLGLALKNGSRRWST